MNIEQILVNWVTFVLHLSGDKNEVIQQHADYSTIIQQHAGQYCLLCEMQSY